MIIPSDQIEWTRKCLRDLIDERTSAPWACYSEEDLSRDDQDYEDIENISTVQDVLQFLRDQGGRTIFIEYASCLDPLGKYEGDTDEDNEDLFRHYLSAEYSIPMSEFL